MESFDMLITGDPIGLMAIVWASSLGYKVSVALAIDIRRGKYFMESFDTLIIGRDPIGRMAAVWALSLGYKVSVALAIYI